MKFICPSAPRMPITANFGMLVPAWFDVNELGMLLHSILYAQCHNICPSMNGYTGTRNFPTDGWKGLLESVQMVRRILIDEVDSGTPPHRIIIAGFSQGAIVAIATAFNTD
uniref:palmitoyl-protein hydrolase n=1 Tax=Lygus hesperus TaxID=30085 RepID=A0A0A9XDG4_LYGHE